MPDDEPMLRATDGAGRNTDRRRLWPSVVACPETYVDDVVVFALPRCEITDLTHHGFVRRIRGSRLPETQYAACAYGHETLLHM